MITSKSRNVFDTLPSPPTATQLNPVAIALFVLVTGAGIVLTLQTRNPYWAVAGVLLGWTGAQAPRVAQQWERAVMPFEIQEIHGDADEDGVDGKCGDTVEKGRSRVNGEISRH